jgi:hypothetical protein
MAQLMSHVWPSRWILRRRSGVSIGPDEVAGIARGGAPMDVVNTPVSLAIPGDWLGP